MFRLSAIAAIVASASAQGFSGTLKDWSVFPDVTATMTNFVADFDGSTDNMAAVGLDFNPVDAGMSCSELLAIDGNTDAMTAYMGHAINAVFDNNNWVYGTATITPYCTDDVPPADAPSVSGSGSIDVDEGSAEGKIEQALVQYLYVEATVALPAGITAAEVTVAIVDSIVDAVLDENILVLSAGADDAAAGRRLRDRRQANSNEIYATPGTVTVVDSSIADIISSLSTVDPERDTDNTVISSAARTAGEDLIAAAAAKLLTITINGEVGAPQEAGDKGKKSKSSKSSKGDDPTRVASKSSKSSKSLSSSSSSSSSGRSSKKGKGDVIVPGPGREAGAQLSAAERRHLANQRGLAATAGLVAVGIACVAATLFKRKRAHTSGFDLIEGSEAEAMLDCDQSADADWQVLDTERTPLVKEATPVYASGN